MGEVLGIDLGTTNTVIAGRAAGGKVSALGNADGEKLMPSVVSFHPNGSVLVGQPAKERRLIDARSTVYSIKRLIGRSWDSAEVQRARSRFPFEMREGPGHAALVVARGQTYTLPEISAFVLRKAKQVAEEVLGAPVDRAVVTVPANFNDLQRSGTKLAGRVAGLEVLRILNEPTAAALAYGHGRWSAERLAVYDFGGGTFDLTLLGLSGRMFEVLATAGDTFLGGDDIDELLGERIADAFLQQHRYDLRTNPEAYERLRAAAEEIKIRLSEEESVTVELPEIAHGGKGSALDFTFSLTRTELEELCAPLVERSLEVCREALSVARLDPSDFDQVLLVGGTTRIPYVRHLAADFFGRDPVWHISPDEVVAIGAGLQAAALTAGERRRTGIPGAPPPRTSPPIATTMAGVGGRTLPGTGTRTAPPPLPPPAPRTAPGTGPPPPPEAHPLFDADDDMEEPTRIHSRASTAPPPGPGPASGTPSNMSATEAALRARIAEQEAELASVPPLPVVGEPAAPAGAGASMPALPVVGTKPMTTASGAPRAFSGAPPALPVVGTGTLPGVPQSAPPSSSDFTEIEPDAVLSESGLPMPGLPPVLGGSRPPLAPPVAPPKLPPHAPAAAVGSGDEPSKLISAGIAAAASAARATEPTDATAPLAVKAPDPATPAPFQVAPAVPRPDATPHLVDVTPLSLSVETVGGYCDAIIDRNTALPCAESRVFVTASDYQTSVRVRVAQGESAQFGQNTTLGEIELLELRPAPRGEVQIEVTFALDTDGILNVSAKDLATNRTTSAQLRLEGLPDAAELERLQARHAAVPTV